MMRFVWGLVIIILFSTNQVPAQQQQAEYNAIVNRYIQQYKDIAVKEMKEYRIPASITLAQGILESNAGRSPLALEANNHFGIKCHKEWTGPTFYKDDETKGECFRKYDSPLESFRDHSQFLTTRDRYKGLFKLDITDYRGWATGLKSAGYATNPAYPQLLIKTIETFLLDRYDRPVPPLASHDSLKEGAHPVKLQETQGFVLIGKGIDDRNIYENKGLRMIIATGDDNLYLISRDFNTSVNRLLRYNDLPKPTALIPGQIVYLEPKHRRGSVESHKVQNAETLYSIAQWYGIKMKMLRKRNNLRIGDEPAAGTVLRLR
ncbi:MAG: glucosaminidase domain-containing protein [Bacteroidetes bacterium]|nr:glucosaminidase domain-containing protein [Bacteroidota bacterium]